ncbi:hypothetical protein EJV46_01355 [Roseococcus sp. SYP-B2431]|uniref:SOS response-associated peptidase family protein n=1 Tax=Roseococcus sp. SYP-B2431 TaxID=2496640 RepID=UPI00103CA922|nr:SOS response-associated peptidase family protein [Roseococcus sp. SYP-B2431]TCI00685.1 hypothetical protein EJV46_01355 [Roseococcus sp. SYP-B2431]
MTADLLERVDEVGDGRPGSLGVVLRRHPKTGQRHVDRLVWGLLPHDTRDPRTAPRPLHARAETVASLPIFADAFRHRRAIVPVDEIQQRNTRQVGGPARYAPPGGTGGPWPSPGLWEGYRGPDGEVIRTYADACQA